MRQFSPMLVPPRTSAERTTVLGPMKQGPEIREKDSIRARSPTTIGPAEGSNVTNSSTSASGLTLRFVPPLFGAAFASAASLASSISHGYLKRGCPEPSSFSNPLVTARSRSWVIVPSGAVARSRSFFPRTAGSNLSPVQKGEASPSLEPSEA